MKVNILVSTVVLGIALSGCMQTRYITERYIKNTIEKHQEGEFSTIRTYSIYQSSNFGTTTYLELTGYKYHQTKALVIGTDRYYQARQKFKGDQTVIADINYIELSELQCRNILTNYKILQDRIKKEKPRKHEEIYHDFTVSRDLFISFRKSAGEPSITYIDIWINGEKYRIATEKIMSKLTRFMNY